MMHENTFSVLV